MPPGSAPTEPDPLRRRAGRALAATGLAHPVAAVTSLVVFLVLVLVGVLMPVPYVIEEPGPAINVLGKYEDEQILTVSGQKTYPTEGSLMMTTVSVDGSPGYSVTPVELVRSWFDPSRRVLPREALFPEQQTRQQTDLQNSVQMNSSQQDAVAAALTELDITYQRTVVVTAIGKDAPAADTLKPGDAIVSVNGVRSHDIQALREASGKTPAGTKVAMTVRRDGKRLDLQVPAEQKDGRATMGIVLGEGYDFPVDVDISIGEIGGPSAGTMFALSIYDELTPGALTGGKDIAGTGTIDAEGKVGPIGGIRQKMIGAKKQGADYFLAPGKNCNDVTGNIPDGLHVVRIDSLDGALDATETIAETGSVEGLPTCEAP